MQKFKQIAKWGVIPVALMISVTGFVSDAKDIATWGIEGWIWYLIGFLILIASSTFIIVGLWKENKLLKKGQGAISDNELKIMEWRKGYRESASAEVSQIPATLKKIWNLVDEVIEEKKKKRPSEEKLINVVANLLQIDKDDPILNTSHYNTEIKIKKMTKQMKVKMGLRSSDTKIEALWRKRLSETMDDHKIGLMLKQNNKYILLLEQLEKEGEPISKTMIYYKIDSFIDNLCALNSVRLFLYYGRVTKRLHIFPREMRERLKHLEDTTEKAMRTHFVKVKEALEDYSIGKNFDEK